MRDGNNLRRRTPVVETAARDLPMRDGNFAEDLRGQISGAGPRPSYEGWKRTDRRQHQLEVRARDLPMRDGNSVSFSTSFRTFPRPRPSYEGWKLRRRRRLIRAGLGPRPSYEGWKLYNGNEYECSKDARDLPMRDGNTGEAEVRGYFLVARDLPMRDGNMGEAGPEAVMPLSPRPSYEGWKLRRDRDAGRDIRRPATFL